MPRMTGGEATVQALLAQGVDTLFVLPGVQNDALFSALYEAAERLRVIVTRHEQAAGYMAFGYAAASGRPGAYCVVPGPGFLNTTAALATAYACNAPVAVPVRPGAAAPHRPRLRPAARAARPARHHAAPDQVGGAHRGAARRAAPDRRGVRADADRPAAPGRARDPDGRAGGGGVARRRDARAREVASPELDPEALERAAALLNGAARPMIFVGGGAQGASAQVRELAERLGAPVVAGWMGQGVMDGRSPLSLSLTMAHRLWPEVDVALALGSRFQRVQTDWGLDDAVKVIRIDLDPIEITRHARPEVALLADAALALDALLPQVRAVDRPAWRRRIAEVKEQVQALYRRELAPQVAFLDAIRAALPEDGILVEDLTQVGYVARIAFPVHGPRQYISSGYQGTLGHAYPSALGAKVARPERAVVALAGDGGFMYNVQELATAVLHGINVVALVFNDGAYGNVRRMQRELYGNRVIASDLVNPDFVRLADSFGVFARSAEDPDGLRDALEQALARDVPALIEVKVGEFPDPWRQIVLPRVRG